jgi:glycosyltransferase involved in cell wall biosynthesis
MRIVLDNIIFFLQQSGGVSVYWYEVLHRLQAHVELQLTYREPKGIIENIFYSRLRPTLRGKVVRSHFHASLLSFLKDTYMPDEKFIFHSSYYRVSSCKRAINIVTIHDMIPEMYFGGLEKLYHVFRKRRAIINAHGIICISQNTYADLIKFYPAVKKIPVKVIYNGVSSDYFPLQSIAQADSRPFVLFVGKRFSYKNFDFASSVMSKLPDFDFYIVGDPLSDRESKFLSDQKVAYKVFERPDNQKLNELYNKAHCLLYPSYYEGFGIPVVEAMQSGCPVVGLHGEWLKEIGGDAALLATQLSEEVFADLIESLSDNGLRQRLVAKGIENARKFTWDNSVDALVDFYREVWHKNLDIK